MEPEKQRKNEGGNRGGYRPGSGRKKGGMNKLAAEAVEKAKATGMLPHEFLLAMVRGEPIYRNVEKTDPDTGEITVARVQEVYDLESRKDAAKAAAPYFAPRISAVEVLHGADENALDTIIAELAREAGVSLGPDGESEAEENQGSQGAGKPSRTRVTLRRD